MTIAQQLLLVNRSGGAHQNASIRNYGYSIKYYSLFCLRSKNWLQFVPVKELSSRERLGILYFILQRRRPHGLEVQY
jgi:hypothetical protein